MTPRDFVEAHLVAFFGNLTDAVFTGLLPVAVIAAIVWVPLRIARPSPEFAGIGGLFALVGGTIGVMLGASREPAVQAVLPAILTLIAGYLAWLLRSDRDQMHRLFQGLATTTRIATEDADRAEPRFVTQLVVAAVAGLMLSAAMGTMWGAALRADAERDDRRYEAWRLMYETQQLPLSTENLRRQMGLPPGASE
jgi:hypothetical protein